MIRKYRWIFLIIASIVTIFGICNIVISRRYGFFSFDLPQGPSVLLNSLTFALCCLATVLVVVSGRATLMSSALRALMILVWFLALSLAGRLCTDLAVANYAQFIVIASVVIVVAVFMLFYFKRRKRFSKETSSNSIRKSAANSGANKYCFSVITASFWLMMAVTAFYFVMTFKSPGNFFVMMPLAVTLLAFVFWRLAKWRGVLLIAFCYVLASSSVYLYGSYVFYGFKAMEVILPFTLLYTSLLVPLADLYCRKDEIA